MADDRLVGTWTYLETRTTFADGEVRALTAADRAGMLMYDAAGHVAVQIMGRDRPKFASGNRLQGTDAEVRAAYEGYVAYFGTYTVSDDGAYVTHHAEGNITPNGVGGDIRRYLEFEADRLTLRMPASVVEGRDAVVSVHWRRVG